MPEKKNNQSGRINTATITFNGAANYGARLQTYALQKTLEHLGFQNDVLDFDCAAINKGYESWHWGMLVHPKELVKVPLNYRSVKRRNKRFAQFTQDFIKVSARMCKQTDLAACSHNYDAIVTGSDQVFNGTLHGHHDEYFLSFSPDAGKNLSYAGSFGFSQIPAGEEEWYRQNLAHLGQISCREKTGARLVRELTGRDATVDLDPAMLLTGQEWSEALAGRDADYGFRPGEYIFTYMLDTYLVEALAKQIGLPLVNIQFGRTLRHVPPGNNIYDAGPLEFVNLLLGAKYVLTGSFHATVFSLLLHKPFLTMVPPKVGSRITDLLGSLGLDDHLWHEGVGEIPGADWEKVDAELARRREISLEHLRKMVLTAAGRAGTDIGQD